MNYANVPLIRVKKFANTMSIITKVLMILEIIVISLMALLMVLTMFIPADLFEVTVVNKVIVSVPLEKYFGEEYSFDAIKGYLVEEDGMTYKEIEGGMEVIQTTEQTTPFAMMSAAFFIPNIINMLCWVFLYWFLSSFFTCISRGSKGANTATLNNESQVFTLAGRKALKSVLTMLIVIMVVEAAISVLGMSISRTSFVVALAVYFGILIFDYIASLVQRNALQQEALDQLNCELGSARAQLQQMQSSEPSGTSTQTDNAPSDDNTGIE